MPINASYEYLNAEKEYLNALKLEDKIYWLEEMIKKAPKHKGSENLLVELKTRLRKFREKAEKAAKKVGGKKGIRKEGFQFVIVGFANSGKSLLLSKLTNAKPTVSDFPFATKEPEIGTFDFNGVKAQVIDMPSAGSENFDIGISNTADCLLIVIETSRFVRKINKSMPNLDGDQEPDHVPNFSPRVLDEIEALEEIEKILFRAKGKRIIVVKKSDILNYDEKRRLNDRIKSRKIDGIVVSALTGEGIEELKKKMFLVMGMIRIFMKEPGKPKSNVPAVLPQGSTVKDVAESIYKGFSARIKETHLTGPSSKFSNQKVGLGHVLQDLDIVEFHTY